MSLHTFTCTVTPEDFALSSDALARLLAAQMGGALQLPHRWTEWQRGDNTMTTQQTRFRMFNVEPRSVVFVEPKAT